MSPQDAARDGVGQPGFGIFAVFDFLEDPGLAFTAFRMGGQVRGYAGIKIPTIIIEFPGDTVQFGGRRNSLEFHQPEDDVHHLDTGVVDIILDFDVLAPMPLATGQGVAETGVSEMPDVGRLVRIDVGVFDDDLVFLGDRDGAIGVPENRRKECRPIEEKIDVSRPGDIQALDTIEGEKASRDFRGQSPGIGLEPAGELERKGQGDVAQGGVRRRRELDVARLQRIEIPEPFGDLFFQAVFEVDHGHLL
jgi:hypothetical protein